MTNVSNLGLPQWRQLAEQPENRCLIPVTEFAEWTPDLHDVGCGRPIEGEMWFALPAGKSATPKSPSGSPAVSSTGLIEGMLARDAGGHVRTDYRPEGLAFEAVSRLT